ncbi:thioredoxin domain-containing protein [Microlunatus endophyticus]|uniref:Thioredoxin domain-containing protein n=1 Tax=Microlunatus endophyticus TaxID=1716077 RepID=A0A917S0L4_9ACTN|nr:thioredoxin domain-containing protein [Microlunatus endophyticus]GGL46797.1 thioredoxin domain-containing protein [Microlunatus endophyticus]
MANRLAAATSPYLLQHAENPVDWWEWIPEAFEEARRRDVPILLSVGYAACHWCHVMAHESFEDEAIAAKINSGFVAIKVDREERPDVDAVYMQATQAMTGQGGWPMTVFLTPAGDPIYAGTYFPMTPMSGMPSFDQVLDAVSGAWRERADEIRAGAADISRRLSDAGGGDVAASIGRDDIVRALEGLGGDYDERHGGFGGAPKFPPSMVLEALLRIVGSWPDQDQRGAAERMAYGTLIAMAESGMYDQLAGGFARYSVDSGWVVPHFEKMLYDNGLLLGCYLHAWRLADDQELRDRLGPVITDTVDWLLSEMVTDQGGFAASLDADSRGPDGRLTEGAYYLWTRDQVHAAVGPELAPWVFEHCRVTETGTAEGGQSTLQLTDLDHDDHERWLEIRARLTAARAVRPRPARDDKVVAAWNALVIDSLADAGALFSRPAWISAAERAGRLLWDLHWTGARLRRVSRKGVVGRADGSAEDYAGVARAYVRLAEVTDDPVWAARSRQLLDILDDHFSAPDGGFYDVADDAESLINRPKDPTDNAYPSGLSTAVHALTRLATYAGDPELSARAERAARSSAKLITAAPRFAGWLLADVVTRVTDSLVEVAITGDPDDQQARDLVRLARMKVSAGSVVVGGLPDTPNVPLLQDRIMINNAPTAYVCRQFVCRMPLTDPDDLVAELTGATD